MPHPLNSSVTGWSQMFGGMPAGLAASIAQDDLGPSREPMRASKHREGATQVVSRVPKSLVKTGRRPRAAGTADLQRSGTSGRAV